MVINRCNLGALFLEMFQVLLNKGNNAIVAGLRKTVLLEVNSEFPFPTALIVS